MQPILRATYGKTKSQPRRTVTAPDKAMMFLVKSMIFAWFAYAKRRVDTSKKLVVVFRHEKEKHACFSFDYHDDSSSNFKLAKNSQDGAIFAHIPNNQTTSSKSANLISCEASSTIANSISAALREINTVAFRHRQLRFMGIHFWKSSLLWH